MRKIEIKRKYEAVITKIMERYNFLYLDNGKYKLMNQKIENEDIKNMLYQMRESIKQIYNDQNLLENINICLGLTNKSKEGSCIIQ